MIVSSTSSIRSSLVTGSVSAHRSRNVRRSSIGGGSWDGVGISIAPTFCKREQCNGPQSPAPTCSNADNSYSVLDAENMRQTREERSPKLVMQGISGGKGCLPPGPNSWTTLKSWRIRMRSLVSRQNLRGNNRAVTLNDVRICYARGAIVAIIIVYPLPQRDHQRSVLSDCISERPAGLIQRAFLWMGVQMEASPRGDGEQMLRHDNAVPRTWFRYAPAASVHVTNAFAKAWICLSSGRYKGVTNCIGFGFVVHQVEARDLSSSLRFVLFNRPIEEKHWGSGVGGGIVS